MTCTDKVMVGENGIGCGFGDGYCFLYLDACVLVFIGIIRK